VIEKFFFWIGKVSINIFNITILPLGKFSLFQLEILKLFFKRPFRLKEILFQIEQIGMNAFLVIFLTAFFMGMVEACLLYTSPSPRDGLLSRMPSSA
jgi:phospholipid/cholesterol/gamma-HCH transport system permease protein